MYMKLLEETIRELKGEDLEDDVRATVNLKVDFRLDDQYVPDMNQRLMIYRRMAGARSEDEIAKNVDEVRDRYGPPPTAVLNLADFARIRVLADNLGIETVDRDGPLVVFKFREKAKVDPMRLIGMVQERADLTLLPPSTVKLDLRPRPPVVAAPAGGGKPPATGGGNPSGLPGARSPLQKLAESRGPRPVPKPKRPPAWWAARATTGEVTPGFTKAEILKAAPEDPRAPDGVLAKVTEFLEDLREP